MTVITTNIIDHAIHLRNEVEVKFLELGKCLSEIEREKLWHGGFSSFAEFVERGLRMSKSNASMLISVYETYVQHYNVLPVKLSQVGYSNLYAAIPLLKDDNVEEVLEKAGTLSRRELLDEKREAKHGDHECAPDKEVTLHPCVTCRKLLRV